MLNQVVYCNIGCICRKMLKKLTNCDTCKKAFSSNEENSVYPIADLLNNKTKSKLIYANMNLFNMLMQIEKSFIKHKNSTEVCYKILDEVSNNTVKFSFHCASHKNVVIQQMVHDYILIRMLQYSRLIIIEAAKKSNDLRKQARVNKS